MTGARKYARERRDREFREFLRLKDKYVIQPKREHIYSGNLENKTRADELLDFYVDAQNQLDAAESKRDIKLYNSLVNKFGLEEVKPPMTRKRTVPDEIYSNFLNEAGGLPNSSFENYTDEKIELLQKYFKKFRSGEKQDLSKKDSMKIGATFNYMIKSAQKRV